MTSYARSAYGSNNPNAGYPANGDFAAWGGHCYPAGVPDGLLGHTDYTSGSSGQRLRVQVRKELVPLWNLAFRIMDVKYHYPVFSAGPSDGKPWGPWGHANRAIAGTSRPSGHSAGLSIDINAPYNPYSYTFESNMPPAMVAALESLGLYWGGRYAGQRYDAMHFGFCRRPSTVAGYITKAQQILGSGQSEFSPPKPAPPKEEPLKLDAEDQNFIKTAIAEALTKALRTDKNIVTNDRAATPNDTPYSFESGVERLIRISTGTFVGESGKPHDD